MSANETAINNLLIQTAEVSKRHRKMAQATGGNFNLLQLLRMGHYEVKTHSPILADLLNPLGSHSQGSTFLELFLHHLIRPKSDSLFMKDSTRVVVEEERNIGRVDLDNATGGRIDIHLEDPATNNLLVIENKVYAAEGSQQIDRYSNYIHSYSNRRNGVGLVVFLTLFGEQPTSNKRTPNEEIITLSYSSDIIDWLIQCRKEVATVPIIRESLTSYINLLHTLTNQNPNQQMNQEVTDLIFSSSEATTAAIALSKIHLGTATFERQKPAIEEIARKLKLEFMPREGSPAAKYFQFAFSFPSMRGLNITFEFNGSNCQDLFFGFQKVGDVDESKREQLKTMFEEEFGEGCKSNDGWPAFHWWGPYQNWEGETLLKVLNPKFISDLEDYVTRMTDIADRLYSNT